MLDIYAIVDEDAMWQDPREKCHIGSLSLDECQALSDLWPMLDNLNIHLSFFEDSRVFSREVDVTVEQINQFIASRLPTETTARRAAENASVKFRQILEKSVKEGKGIITFCD